MLPSIRCCGQILHKGCHPALCLLHLPNSLTVFSLTASLLPLLILPLRLRHSGNTRTASFSRRDGLDSESWLGTLKLWP